MSLAERFMAAFAGFGAAHGRTDISEERRAGKTKAKSYVVRKPLTVELVQSHLDGGDGVGAIPINEDNKCKFGALDIDVYPLDHTALIKQLSQNNVPCIVCRSKSGGAHVFFFFKEWMSAGEFRDKAAEIAALLGHGKCEVFPKQEQVLVERGDVGNFINLPYFDAEQTMRPAILPDGDGATLEQFLDMIDEVSVDPNEFRKLPIGGSVDLYPDYIPCVRQMLAMGISEGGRNKFAFQLGIFLKKYDEVNWKTLLEEHNAKDFHPPLPASEIVTIQNQVEKKEWGYLCSEEPMASYCNKNVCRTMTHGIGGGGSLPTISGLSVVMSEPRLWFLDIDGRRLELDTDQLQNPRLFQRCCMEQLNFMPERAKDADWQSLINNLMDNCNQIEVPQELTYKGQFTDLLEGYCTGRVQAVTVEELMLGKPYTDNEEQRTYFRLDSLMEFLRQKKFDSYTRAQIQERIKEMNDGTDSHGVKRFKTSGGKWKSVRVWWVPEFAAEVSTPDIAVASTEVPF